MMLDATAGNRMIWPNKNPPNVVFMDKEIRLAFSPHIFADFRDLPFRDDVFDCVLFDPPHSCSIPPWWNSPTRSKNVNNPSLNAWYGKFENKRDMFSSIHRAQKEFARVAKRLCLKWSELEVTLWKIMPFFKEWEVIQTKPHIGKYKAGKTKTYWITFIRSSLRTANPKS